jgi:hypothetical protein
MARPTSTRGSVDVVVVSYNSRDLLRDCVGPLASLDWVNVIVVENASPQDPGDVLADLPVTLIRNDENLGFGRACNVGWRAGSAPFVLFLNPDARLDAASLEPMIERVERDGTGLVGPRTVTSDGELVHSQRAFVGVGAIWAQVFFLHRIVRNGTWVDGIVRDEEAYQRPETPDWVSGACMLLRRVVVERLGGFDERFFMYCEDRDLCRRVRGLGLEVAFEPRAVAVHDEGSSAPNWRMVPVFVRSHVAYSEKYFRGWRRVAARAGIALHELVRLVLARGGRPARVGHLRGLRVALTSRRD